MQLLLQYDNVSQVTTLPTLHREGEQTTLGLWVHRLRQPCAPGRGRLRRGADA